MIQSKRTRKKGGGGAIGLFSLVQVVMMLMLLVNQPYFRLWSGRAESLAQRQALYDLYWSTNGPGWVSYCRIGGWGTGGSVCNSPIGPHYTTYNGVVCSGQGGEIRSLSLVSCNLQGALPPSFGVLTSLGSMDFYNNLLSGTLPPQWSSLQALAYLGLYNNRLSGTLPPEWKVLTTLQVVYLHNNLLSGTLPPQWSSLQALAYLSLYNNRLSGTLPPEWKVLTTLQVVYLHNNLLSGTLPPQWSSLHALVHLSLHTNQLSGTLPPTWSNLSALMNLLLHVNNFHGTVPKEWPEGMRSLPTNGYCPGSCSGTVGVNAVCSYGATSCLALYLWYNCLFTAPNMLPPANQTNTWNWRDSKVILGQQRTDCPLYATPSIVVSGSVSVTTTHTISNAVTHSIGSTTLSSAATTSNSKSMSPTIGPITLSHSVLESLSISLTQQQSRSVSPFVSGTLSRSARSVSAPSSATESVSGTLSRSARSVSAPSSATASGTTSLSMDGSASFLTDSTTASITPCGEAVVPVQLQAVHVDGVRETVDAASLLVEDNGTAVSVDVSAMLRRLCVVVGVRVGEGRGAGYELDPRGRPTSHGLLTKEIDNVTFTASNVTDGVLWLCTRLESGFATLGVVGGRVGLSLRVPMRCAGKSGRSLSLPVEMWVVAAASRNSFEEAQRAVTSAMLLGGFRAARRSSAALQRVGGGGCSTDVDTGIWMINVGSGLAAEQAGTVLGNVVSVAITWTGLCAAGIMWWVLWRGPTLSAAAVSVHIVSLWVPVAAVVTVPVTTSSVSLIVEAEAASAWLVFGVAGAVMVPAYVACVLWMGATARRVLSVEAIKDNDDAISTRRWWAALLRTSHWKAHHIEGIAMKRRLQLVLDEATLWWYAAVELTLSVGVGVTDGVGKVLSAQGQGKGACVASLAVGLATQLLLLAVIVRLRPHGDLLGQWLSQLTLPLCAAACFLQLLIVVESIDGVATAPIVAAFLLVASGIAWVRYIAVVVTLCCWALEIRSPSAPFNEEEHPSSVSSLLLHEGSTHTKLDEWSELSETAASLHFEIRKEHNDVIVGYNSPSQDRNPLLHYLANIVHVGNGKDDTI